LQSCECDKVAVGQFSLSVSWFVWFADTVAGFVYMIVAYKGEDMDMDIHQTRKVG